MLAQRKSEIRKYKNALSQITETSKKETENTISEYYQKLNELLSESEKKTRERYKILCENQQQIFASYTVNKLIRNINRNNWMKCTKN